MADVHRAAGMLAERIASLATLGVATVVDTSLTLMWAGDGHVMAWVHGVLAVAAVGAFGWLMRYPANAAAPRRRRRG